MCKRAMYRVNLEMEPCKERKRSHGEKQEEGGDNDSRKGTEMNESHIPAGNCHSRPHVLSTYSSSGDKKRQQQDTNMQRKSEKGNGRSRSRGTKEKHD